MVPFMTKPGRNDPCPCGSGKKHKHCCERKAAAPQAVSTATRPTQANYLPLPPMRQRDAAASLIDQGNALMLQGQLDAAIACYRQALVRQPDSTAAYGNLGTALDALGQLDQAVECFEQALLRDPDDAGVHVNFGNALKHHGRLDQAIAHYRQALALQPDFAGACYNLGKALQDQGLFDQAISHYRQALVLKPNYADAYLDLARALLQQGQLDEAVAIYRKVLNHLPDNARAFSNLLFALQNLSTCSPAELFQEHLRYAERIEAPLKPGWQPHANPREPDRRLKVGYVSGDFHRHPVAYFLEPILAHHDKSQVEIFGYSNNSFSDLHTQRIAAAMDHWLVCSGLSDDELAERIRLDAIDILVDLSGHTALNRLPVFARKPAPVQASYIGYPGSTGLSAMNYRISDPWQDPVGLTERYHSETLVRIPGGMAFEPEPDAPDVNALPALRSGELVLACLNGLNKLNPAVVSLWARILQALPQARLMLGNVTDAQTAQRLTQMFGQAGVAPERLMLQPRVPVSDYLALHQRIDLALDPFPYNGGTTTMHSLWMGVPVITLAGSHAVSRLCAAHLSRVGLDEFITHSEDAYLQCAIRFASDLPALNEVRQSLRRRMTAAECDPATITRQLEAAYRTMWLTWRKT
jgi:predicted O-linked N-acetylglucosamine transferase (SPINDLY family)